MLNKGVGESSLLQIFGLIEEMYNKIKDSINGKADGEHKHPSSDITGDINAATLNGYKLRIVTDVNDPGEIGSITVIKRG